MHKMAKNIVKEILTDPLHWLGWAITTLALVGVFALLPGSVMQSYILITLITFAVIVIVDIIKHVTKLQ